MFTPSSSRRIPAVLALAPALFLTPPGAACEDTDCNQNGIADAVDIASGTSLDLDFNGFPDECNGTVATLPIALANVGILTAAPSGDLVCGIGGTGSLLVTIDVSDPAEPVLLGSVELSGAFFEDFTMEIVGDLVYIPFGQWGMQIVDISDPTDPVLRSVHFAAYQRKVVDVAVVDGVAHLALDGCPGYEIIDVSDPDAPVSLWFDEEQEFCPTVEVAAAGGLACLRWEVDEPYPQGSVFVFDVTDPTAPQEVSQFEGYDYIELIGDVAYTRGWNSVFQVADLSDPAAPVISDCGIRSGADLFLDGDRVYLAPPCTGYPHCGSGQLHSVFALDISDPASPRLAAGWSTESWWSTLQLVNDGVAYRTVWPGPMISLEELGGSRPPCQADTDDDGIVGFTDVLAVLAAWGSNDSVVDVNDDGVVDFQDLLAVLGSWGPCV